MALFSKISVEEKVEFANNFAVMLKSGMTITEVLTTLADQTDNKKFKQILNDVRARVQAGTPLSKAFEPETKTFGNIFISMLKVGESSGTLSESLGYLAQWEERDHTLQSEINAAVMYPKFVFGATIVMGAGLALYILPKLVPLFSQLKVDLPMPTKVLLWVTQAVQDYWYIAIAIMIVLYFGFKFLNKIRPVKKFLHLVYIKMPILGSLITMYQLALVTRLFETLLKSGLSLRESIEISAGAVSNINYEDSLLAINERVKGGTPLSEGMKDFPGLYPKNLVSIVATGEKSGSMDTSLQYLADHYLQEVQARTKKLPTILEPALLMFIGLVVGFVAFAIIMPIYKLSSGVLK